MAKNNKTCFFYVLYSDKTRVFDQSEHVYYPIYIIITSKNIIVTKLFQTEARDYIKVYSKHP